MFNVRLAGGHLYGKQLFTWLSLVVSLMSSFVLSFFPLDVLDEIWDLIESVSGGFLTYSLNSPRNARNGQNGPFFQILRESRHNKQFLLFFSMNYTDFSVKIETIVSLFRLLFHS